MNSPALTRFAGALVLPVLVLVLAVPVLLAVRDLGSGLSARAVLASEVARLDTAEGRLSEALAETLTAARLEPAALDMRLSRAIAEMELAEGLEEFSQSLAAAPVSAVSTSDVYELPLTPEASSLAADLVFLSNAETALALLSGPALLDLDVMELELLALADGRIRVSLTIACRYKLEAGNAA